MLYLSAIIIVSFLGCNSLFYYPDRTLHADPHSYGNGLEEHSVSSGTEQLHLVKFTHAGPLCKALVVQFHGNAQNLTSHSEYVAWLSHEGFDVVTFDYRGYGLSTGTPTREGLVEDGVNILRFAESINSCKSINVIGQSLGGAVAIPSIVRSNVPVSHLIIDSSFPSYRRIARRKLAEFWLSWPIQWPLSFLVGDSYAPEDDLENLMIPIVVMHGARDPVVPIEMGRELFDSVKSSNKNFWLIPGGGHAKGFLKKNIQTKIVEFLNS